MAIIAATSYTALPAGAQISDEPILFYDMSFSSPADKMEDLGTGVSTGTLYGFAEPIGAYGEEDSGTTTFVSFDGDQHIATDERQPALNEFEIEIEFRTDTPGGKIIGFEDRDIALGPLADRTLYVTSDGHIHFSGASGVSIGVKSREPVTDGQWHTAIGRSTIVGSQPQFELILDGVSQGTTTARVFTSYPGFWRIGRGNMNGFPDSGGDGFVGDVRSVKIYDLSGAEPQATPTPVPGPSSLDLYVPIEPAVVPVLHLDPPNVLSGPGGVTGILDQSGNLNHGTFFFFDDPAAAINTEPSDPTVQTSIRFDGIDDVLGTSNAQNAPDNLTLSVWFRTDVAGGKIAGFENNIAFGSTQADRHLYVDEDGRLRFGGDETALNNLATYVSFERVDDGEWHNVIITLESSGDNTSMVMYLDGRRVVGGNSGRFAQYQGFWRLGGGNLDIWPGVTNAFFDGDIGPFVVYNQSLPFEQLAWLAQPPVQSIPTDSSLSLWFDAADEQGADTIMFDLSGNGVFGALNNFEDPANSFHPGGEGPVSRLLRFDGFNDLVVTDRVIPAPDEFTMAVWFRTSFAGGVIAGLDNATPGAEADPIDRVMYIDVDGHLRFGMRNDDFVTVASTEQVNNGAWHFAVGTVDKVGDEYVVKLSIGNGRRARSVTTSVPFRQFQGFWLIGNGTVDGWPDASTEAFGGDFGSLRIYDRALTPDEVFDLFESFGDVAPQPTPTPFFEPDFPHDHEEFDFTPRVDVSSGVDGDALTLDISLRNIDLFDSDVWVVREEDGEEFFVGTAQPEMSWEGEAVTSRFTVEVRREFFGEPIDGEESEVLASGSIPIFHQPASAVQVGTAVAVTVAVAGAASAASASGTWIYELIWRFLRIVLAERLRRRTKTFDVSSLPSWIAATTAVTLMAILIAVARPGSLELNNIFTALVVVVPAVILFRLVTILGGYALAYYTDQKPKYVLWAVGSISFAATSILLQSPIGYTGYMERDPSTKERDARFATAGFAAVLALSGLFVMIGLLTRMSFAEIGVTLTLGVLAVMMLPFPLMAGNAIWKWNRIVGAASGVVGMMPYVLFQLGLLSPTAIVTLATFGLLAFLGFLIGELWLVERERMNRARAAAEASAEGASAI